MKPWLVSITLAATLQSQKLGLDLQAWRRPAFSGFGRGSRDKPIDELETAEFQITTFANFDAKLQEEQLVLTLAENKDLRDDLTRMTDAWLARRTLRELREAAYEELERPPETGEVLQKLIYDRNVPMTEKVEALSSKSNKTVFPGCRLRPIWSATRASSSCLQNDNFTVEQSTATPPAKAEKQPAESGLRYDSKRKPLAAARAPGMLDLCF